MNYGELSCQMQQKNENSFTATYGIPKRQEKTCGDNGGQKNIVLPKTGSFVQPVSSMRCAQIENYTVRRIVATKMRSYFCIASS